MPANRKRFSAESTGRAAGRYQVGCSSQQVVPLPRWRSHLGSKREIKLGFASIFKVKEIKEMWRSGPISSIVLVGKWTLAYWHRLTSTSFGPSDACMKRWQVEAKPVMAQEVGEQMARPVSEGLGMGSPHLEHIKVMCAHSWSQQRAC